MVVFVARSESFRLRGAKLSVQNLLLSCLDANAAHTGCWTPLHVHHKLLASKSDFLHTVFQDCGAGGRSGDEGSGGGGSRGGGRGTASAGVAYPKPVVSLDGLPHTDPGVMHDLLWHLYLSHNAPQDAAAIAPPKDSLVRLASNAHFLGLEDLYSACIDLMARDWYNASPHDITHMPPLLLEDLLRSMSALHGAGFEFFLEAVHVVAAMQVDWYSERGAAIAAALQQAVSLEVMQNIRDAGENVSRTSRWRNEPMPRLRQCLSGKRVSAGVQAVTLQLPKLVDFVLSGPVTTVNGRFLGPYDAYGAEH